jgi:hypothetical protein
MRRETSVRVAGIRAEVSTQVLPNTNHEFYPPDSDIQYKEKRCGVYNVRNMAGNYSPLQCRWPSQFDFSIFEEYLKM